MDATADPPLEAQDPEEVAAAADAIRRLRARKRGLEGSEGDTATSPSRARLDAAPTPTLDTRASGRTAASSGVTLMPPPDPRRRSGSNTSAGSNFPPAGTPRAATPSSATDETPAASRRGISDTELRFVIVNNLTAAAARGDEVMVALWKEQLDLENKVAVRTTSRE